MRHSFLTQNAHSLAWFLVLPALSMGVTANVGVAQTSTVPTVSEPVASAPVVSGEISDSVSATSVGAATTAQRAVDYLESRGQQWITRQGCVSCHQIPSLVWSLGMAERAGIDLDREQLKQQILWATDPVNFVKSTPLEKQVDVDATLTGNIDTMAQLLLAIPSATEHAWRPTFLKKLVALQATDGSWNACGQLPAQKRPVAETHAVTTLWVTYALLTDGVSGFDADRAIAFAEKNGQGASTEWFVTRYLVARAMADPQVATHLQHLLDQQHDDGGWGWLVGDPSDAMATGMALYAIGEDASGKPAAERACRYLATTQQPDGHWEVHGTKKSSQHKTTPTSDYWGTAWGVIGLLSSDGS